MKLASLALCLALTGCSTLQGALSPCPIPIRPVQDALEPTPHMFVMEAPEGSALCWADGGDFVNREAEFSMMRPGVHSYYLDDDVLVALRNGAKRKAYIAKLETSLDSTISCMSR